MEICAEFYSILAHLKRGVTASQHQKTVQQIIDRIADNVRHPWTLEQLSRLSGYSVNHLIEIFRRETGMTPHAYIRETRLHAAQNLLITTDMSLASVSEECGFGSYVNFYRAFVQVHHITPQAWRLRHLEASGRKFSEKKPNKFHFFVDTSTKV